MLFDELHRIAQYEGVPDAAKDMDISVDWIFGRDQIRVQIVSRGTRKFLWSYIFRVSEWDLDHMDEDTFDVRITEAMRANLSIVGQMHHAWLDQHFPRRIKKVTVHYRGKSKLKMIHVEFMNGHIAEGPEIEIKTDLFLARCCMLYDLPSL